MPFRPFLLVVLLARAAAAQAGDSTRAVGSTVTGVVYDSVARKALAGAIVQMVTAEGATPVGRSAVSDSGGRFTIRDLPAGLYTIGFLHPMLDSLGLEPTLKQLRLDGHRSLIADLAIPSPARLRAAVCGQRQGAALVGVVRNARSGEPVANARVVGEWIELTLSANGFLRTVPRRVATTRENGWFVLCGVPSPGTMVVAASLGADSTDLIEIRVPADGFTRRELYVGAARTVVVLDSAPRPDSAPPTRRRVHVGDGRISGSVVGADGGQPLAGVQVRIADGPQTRSNARGEWTLIDVPDGTRMLEVRAVSYYPERRPVDVVGSAPPVRIELTTLRSVLDTVRISASRMDNRDFISFLERKRSGVGRYVTEQDIARRRPNNTTELFQNMQGVKMPGDPMQSGILVRGGLNEWCDASIYLDGMYLRDITADDLDHWVRPNEIAGIEVYPSGTAPPQFQPTLNVCGSIVIWRK